MTVFTYCTFQTCYCPESCELGLSRNSGWKLAKMQEFARNICSLDWDFHALLLSKCCSWQTSLESKSFNGPLHQINSAHVDHWVDSPTLECRVQDPPPLCWIGQNSWLRPYWVSWKMKTINLTNWALGIIEMMHLWCIWMFFSCLLCKLTWLGRLIQDYDSQTSKTDRWFTSCCS